MCTVTLKEQLPLQMFVPQRHGSPGSWNKSFPEAHNFLFLINS